MTTPSKIVSESIVARINASAEVTPSDSAPSSSLTSPKISANVCSLSSLCTLWMSININSLEGYPHTLFASLTATPNSGTTRDQAKTACHNSAINKRLGLCVTQDSDSKKRQKPCFSDGITHR